MQRTIAVVAGSIAMWFSQPAGAQTVNYEFVDESASPGSGYVTYTAILIDHQKNQLYGCRARVLNDGSGLSAWCTEVRGYADQSQIPKGSDVPTVAHPRPDPGGFSPSGLWQVDRQRGTAQFCAATNPVQCIDVTPLH